jgi:hypothetical protein
LVFLAQAKIPLMKKFLLTPLFLVCLFLFMNAQSLIIAPNDTFTFSGPLVNEFDHEVVEGFVTYTGSVADTVQWYVHTLNYTTGWEMSVCDINNCYIIYTPGSVYEFVAQPNVDNLLDFGVTPYCIAGSGELELTLWIKSDSAATVRKARFTAEYTGTCVSSVKETALEKVKVYPTGFQSRITVEGADGAKITAVKMYDALGTLVNDIKPLNSGNIVLQTSELASGVYIVRVETSAGVISRRVVKE